MVLVLIETLVNRTPYLGSILLHPPTVSCLRSCGGWFGGELGLEPRKTPRLVAPLECTFFTPGGTPTCSYGISCDLKADETAKTVNGNRQISCYAAACSANPLE